jgi:antitoxin VapB
MTIRRKPHRTKARKSETRQMQQDPRQAALMLKKLKEILDRFDRLPVLDNRSAEEILGYDENGVPR